jgi:hypothetical protein
MGVAASSVPTATKTVLPASYFIIDRMFAANCEFLKGHKTQNIVIGTFKNPEPQNPLGWQGIRIGDGEILPLKNFQKNKNSVIYEFDRDTKLSLFKRDDQHDVFYNLRTPTLNITEKVAPIIAKHFKDISHDSKELDEIKEFLQ